MFCWVCRIYRSNMYINNTTKGTSVVVQRLRLHAPNAGGRSSIPGQGTRSRTPQLRPSAAK